MAFWNNVNSGLKKAVDEGWIAVRDSAKIGKNRYKLHTLHKQAETLFAEIGGILYDMADSTDENPLSRPEVRDLIDDIKRIEAESAKIESEIEQTREKDKPDEDGGAVEGAWPEAVSKEAYSEDEVSDDEVSEDDDSDEDAASEEDSEEVSEEDEDAASEEDSEDDGPEADSKK